MIIRDISFYEASGHTVALIRVGVSSDNLEYVGSFAFDEFYKSKDNQAVFLRKGFINFVSDESLYDLYLQFRKQDEAPEMGADSSSNIAPIRGVK